MGSILRLPKVAAHHQNLMTRLVNLFSLLLCLGIANLSCAQSRLPITLIGEGSTQNSIFVYYQDEFQDQINPRFSPATAAGQWPPLRLAAVHSLWLQLSGDGMQQYAVYARPGDTVYVRAHPGESPYYTFRGAPHRRYASAEARFYTVLQQHGLGVEFPDALGLFFNARYPFQTKRLGLKRDQRLALLHRQRDSLLLSPAFVRFAEQQIQVQYLGVLFAPYFDKEHAFKQFPASYPDIVSAATPAAFLANDTLALFLPSYQGAALGYVRYLSRDSLDTSAELTTQYRQARTALRGRTRDYVWFFLLKHHLEKHPPAYNACYAQFRRECTTTSYVRYLDSLMTRPTTLQQRADLLRTPLLSSTGTTVTWGQLVAANRGKPTYFDLWASWCGPCLAEMPASATLHSSDAGKDLNFVYISMDTNKAQWLKAITDHGLNRSGNQHYLLDPKSTLATFLGAPPIPLYLLLDKQGRAASLDAPRPGEPRLLENLAKLR
jgi:thiol-disulfide isomerase/thioredoxin